MRRPERGPELRCSSSFSLSLTSRLSMERWIRAFRSESRIASASGEMITLPSSPSTTMISPPLT